MDKQQQLNRAAENYARMKQREHNGNISKNMYDFDFWLDDDKLYKEVERKIDAAMKKALKKFNS